MTEHEQLMYQILGKISEADAPMVFKGALITKLVLAEQGFTQLNRQTNDIDANWIGRPPSMDHLVATIQNSLGNMQEQFYAVAIREYGEKKSAGISIRTKSTDEEFVTMDISVKPVVGSREYHYGEIGIKGVLANEILADKIAVLSKPLVFRRAKDLVDVYALAQCVEVQTLDLMDIWDRKGAVVGGFIELRTRCEDIEYAYDKLKGIEGKPKFAQVYPCLLEFTRPFIEGDKTPRAWSSEQLIWNDMSRIIETPSVRTQLREATQNARKLSSDPTKKKHKNEPER